MKSLIRKFDNPFNYLERFFDDDWFRLDRFNDFFHDRFDSAAGRVNVVNGDKDITIEVSAPGFNKDELNVKVHDGAITVSGEHKDEKNEKDDNYSRREFSSQSFTRTFSIPENVDG